MYGKRYPKVAWKNTYGDDKTIESAKFRCKYDFSKRKVG
jgi:hypothetical protein